MSTVTVAAALIHPDQRERSPTVDLLVDTAATDTLLPVEIVAELGLATPYAQAVELASGERIVYRAGEGRIHLGPEALPTILFTGPLGSLPLTGAVTQEGGLRPMRSGRAGDSSPARSAPGRKGVTCRC